ncbi:hypothetical protein EJ06DRAFT_521019 [Trichodelitschia bisporula]|uniref:UBA domain-containing protein n=1 Tax=Trichodelitschia bisporula TaxID=703511 RepID=A0A6G1HYJ9_9PEZI|nr:hypothetical protein EJ06DRAFT_521019 [Trichodelitschia bisporula]
MVFQKTLHIARATLPKLFTHAYAQPVVAATQSSLNTNNGGFGGLTGRITKAQSLQLHNAFAAQREGKDADAGLAAYYAAWQKTQQIGRDWQQFQFAKRIEWKPQTLLAESREQKEKAVEGEVLEDGEAEYAVAEAEAAADAAAEAKIEDITAILETSHESQVAHAEPANSQLDAAYEDVTSSTRSPQTSATGIATEETSITPFSEADSFTHQLTQLESDRQYADIPATFEAMLNAGVQPSATAYNALLAAAIHLPRSHHHVVPKALDVYSDMLRRRVAPDAKTYATLIELLSARAIDIVGMRAALEEKRTRYGGVDVEGRFMLKSEEAEFGLLADENTRGLAVRLFDAAVAAEHPIEERTYRLLVSACAEEGKIADMVRIYAHMESGHVVPRPEMFVQMIHAFATADDLASAIECYDEYKALAIAHDNGEVQIVRKDVDVYAAVIKAYYIAHDASGATKFFSKLEAATSEDMLAQLRDTATLRAILPELLEQGQFVAAFEHACVQLNTRVRDAALAAVCIRAADKNSADVATQAYQELTLSPGVDTSMPAVALCAMYIRKGNVEAAEPFWALVEVAPPRVGFVQLAAMQAMALTASGRSDIGLRRARTLFARVREVDASSATVAKIDEAIEAMGAFMSKQGILLSPAAAMDLLGAMVDNHGLVPTVAAHVLAGFGPEAIATLSWEDLALLTRVQATMIINGSTLDIAQVPRLTHMIGMLVLSGHPLDVPTTNAIDTALTKVENPALSERWLAFKFGPPATSPVSFSPVPTVEDSFDPYAATTDNKGSVAITELLEKPHGRPGSHLNDALQRYNAMRRAGRHPRFFTYARLITAAAKDNRLQLIDEIMQHARNDVPLQPQFRIVRFGWVQLLDAMVAACLTTGQRDMAARYHAELRTLGAAPSANTFGLYITTLGSAGAVHDEAREAAAIFAQAQAEGVEPSSFLYNALIGKLGKARRIDECLMHFTAMRQRGIRPTSVTYGTVVNALCRVSDEALAEELFAEMEAMPNYKPRPAPYHSLMQFFLAQHDRGKVLGYYEKMRKRGIAPTPHTYKLLIDTHASLDPPDFVAAEKVLSDMKAEGAVPEAVHYAALVHARGCVARDLPGARVLFDSVLADPTVRPAACLFQAIIESCVANASVSSTPPILATMHARGVQLTAYIANALIHGWALAGKLEEAERVWGMLEGRREPNEALDFASSQLEQITLVGPAPVETAAVVRTASANPQSSTSPAMKKRTPPKRARTYAGSRTRLADEEHTLETHLAVEGSSGDTIPNTAPRSGSHPESASAQPWALPPSLLAEFETHEPAMWPEPEPELESTVPNGSGEERAMLGAALQADLLAAAAVVGSVPQPEEKSSASDVPFSQFVQSQYVQTPLRPGQAPIVPIDLLMPTGSVSALHTSSGSEKRSDGKPSSPIKVSGSGNVAWPTSELRAPVADLSEDELLREGLSGDGGYGPANRDGDAAKAPTPVFATTAEPELAKKKRRKRTAEPTSDDLALGITPDLPREVYKPRPSRSRSERVEWVDTNYAKVPEKVIRAQRRAKTEVPKPAKAETSKQEGDEDALAAIVAMGFPDAEARTALKRNGGDMQRAVEWLVGRPQGRKRGKGVDEGVETGSERDTIAVRNDTKRRKTADKAIAKAAEVQPANPPSTDSPPTVITITVKKGGRRKSTTDKPAPKEPEPEPAPPSTASPSPTSPPAPAPSPEPMPPPQQCKRNAAALVSVEIPTKPGSESGTAVDSPEKTREGKRRKTDEFVEKDLSPVSPINVETGGQADLPSAPAPVEKKRRGRPRKVTAPAVPAEEPEDMMDGVLGARDGNVNAGTSTGAREEEPPKHAPRRGKPLSKLTLADTEDDEEPEPPAAPAENKAEEKGVSVLASTPSKGAARPSKLPHSPLPKGKPQYRVGLSRTAKVAPLLKKIGR